MNKKWFACGMFGAVLGIALASNGIVASENPLLFLSIAAPIQIVFSVIIFWEEIKQDTKDL